MTRLEWTDLHPRGYYTAWFGIIMLRVMMEEDNQGNNSGYSVTLVGNKDTELSQLFQNPDNAKIAAERLLWKIVNEMHQELSQYSWDTHNKEEVKWVVR